MPDLNGQVLVQKDTESIDQGWANASWNKPNLKLSNFWWVTRVILIYIVARHRN